jgi:hypothetical protein
MKTTLRAHKQDPHGRLNGDMQKYSMADCGYEKDMVQQQGLQCLQGRDVEIKHGMSAVPVMLQCTQENVSPVTTPKRNICTDIPGNSTFHISVKSIHK